MTSRLTHKPLDRLNTDRLSSLRFRNRRDPNFQSGFEQKAKCWRPKVHKEHFFMHLLEITRQQYSRGHVVHMGINYIHTHASIKTWCVTYFSIGSLFMRSQRIECNSKTSSYQMSFILIKVRASIISEYLFFLRVIQKQLDETFM